MSNIYFTQFLRPDGRKTLIWIDRPDAVAARADFITLHGFRFECEQLTTGDVSFTISDDYGDYAIEVVTNGPGVPEAVDRMILGFDVPTALKQRTVKRSA